jgi:Mg-chelatase subunit ChlD
MSHRVAFALAALASAALAFGLHPYATADHLGATVRGDELELLAPRALFALAALPFLLFALRFSLADLPRAQRYLGVAVRALLLASITLALARPARTTESHEISAVFLVDVSESMSDEALARARDLVEAASRARGENDVQLVTFARSARAVRLPEDGAVPAVTRHEGEHAGAESDLAGALQHAYGLFPPGHLRRAVFVTDGGQTRGDLLAEAARAARFGVQIHYAESHEGAPPEVGVSELELPDVLRVGEPFFVRARLFATRAGRARVRLYQGETLNGLDAIRDLDLVPGDNDVELRSVVHVAGPVTYRLTVTPEGDDRFAANNAFETTVVVPGKPTVLYVEGAEGRGGYLASALTTAGFDVDVRSPRAIPTSLRELERFDFFVLSDVPADQVSMTQIEAIDRYVRQLGGGFMMAGGDRAFGLGGWQGSRMEQMLPVRMDAERRRDQPTLALALVIDRSGSMSGQKIELAKEAAKSTATLLSADDYIEVVGFDSEPQRVVRMQSAANRYQIDRDISRLAARGGTNIFPALDMAYQDLAVTRARIKHVILLTDGQAPEQGIPELVQVMRAEGMTVSTVGLGADVNRALLQSMATLGGGRSYFTNDAHSVPRIFMRETTAVARSAAVEEYFRPRQVAPADFLRGVPLASAPFLHGYVATRAKPSPAQVILESELGEPILARWRLGLGWSMAWTSDVKNRWAVEWLRWPGFSRFWAQLVREHMRQRRGHRLDMRAEVVGDEVRVVVDGIGPDDRFLDGLESTVVMEGPMGAARAPTANREPHDARDTNGARGANADPRPARRRIEHTLRQTAPGRYEARFPAPGYGSFVLTASHRLEGRPVAESATHLSRAYPREYRTLEPDDALLASAARLTSGSNDPSPTSLFDPRGESIRRHDELWDTFLYAALVLYLLDLLLRRVRLFDRGFRRPTA